MKDTTKAGLIGLGIGTMIGGAVGYLGGTYFPAIPPAKVVTTRMAKRESYTPPFIVLDVIFLNRDFNYLYKNTTPAVSVLSFKRDGIDIPQRTDGQFDRWFWNDNLGSLSYANDRDTSGTYTIEVQINSKKYTIQTYLKYNYTQRIIFQTLEI